ncbi:hypothetical protein E3N88_26377 [Mikania micrantha]|uniref:Protein kinase domain-containing protein n=1 Tax=Mikania micrantha TaxID=192012 RepID=A0A5N6NA39_9ASTR|nr:hypothetical protein E3N88_26377 [Mikania micrantha]
MGCAPTKPLMESSHHGLHKLKMDNGYVRGSRNSNSGGRSSSSSTSSGRPGGGGSGGRRDAGNGGKERGEGVQRRRGSGGGSGGDGGDGGGVTRRSSVSVRSDDLDAVVDGWPKWLTDNVPKHALDGLVPKSADAYDKLDKVGSGTYSNVYKARDRKTKKIVALKKVRFDTSEPESIKFMAREIMMLRKLDHPNIVKLEGLATSRMQYSLYLVFDYMQTDLSRIISRPDQRLTEPQAGTNIYGPAIDLWSAGCLLAEMFVGRPILPGRTEVEQLHKIFKLCGTPSADYWKKLKLSTTFRPPHSYKPNLHEAFRDYPRPALGLLMVLLALDPAYRGSAGSALQHEFFHSSPWACDLSGLPVVQVDNDDLAQSNEPKKHRKSRTRHKSRTLKDQQAKDQMVQNPDAYSASLKEETEKKLEVVSETKEPIVTKTSPSGVEPSPRDEVLGPLPSPIGNIYQRYQRQMSESHPNAKMNIKNRPPLPDSKRVSSKYGDIIDDHLTRVPRSFSTREYRNMG